MAYRWGHAIQSGEVADNLVGQAIGPLVHSRWLTREVRTLERYSWTKAPTKKFQRIVFFILNFYLPGWFRIKSWPHCQDGARHFQFLLDLSQDLCEDDQETVRVVMQNNAHWAHPENVVIGCLSDTSEEVRRKGVQYILQARKIFNEDEEVRKFIPPEVNFQSKKFCDLVDLERAQKTEPPVTKDLPEDAIISALAAPLILPPYPNHTQKVERMVCVVTECASKRAGYHGRQ